MGRSFAFLTATVFGLALFTFAPSPFADSPRIQPDELCMFPEDERLQPNTSAEVEEVYQRARAHDITIQADMPETIPEPLRGLKADRIRARTLYAEAAQRGHTGAMNNLAVYEQNGWGHPDPDVFPRNEQAAFYWNTEMSRRGDVRGFIGMGLSYHSGLGVAGDPRMAQACLIEAARRNDRRGILLLGRHDLGLLRSQLADAPNPARVSRGIALLEEVSRRGDPRGFAELTKYYHLKFLDRPEPLKREYYAREEAKLSNPAFFTSLIPIYRFEDEPLYDPQMVDCLNGLAPSDGAALDTMCRRRDGPLTREVAGLQPAPEGPFDLATLRVIDDDI